MDRRGFAQLVLLVSVAGCSTVSLERGQDVAAAGQRYIETIKQVNDLALARSIAFSAELLPGLPRTEQVLDEQTAEMRRRIELVDAAHAYFDVIAAYFAELDVLASGEQVDASANALVKLADSLKAEPVGLQLSEQQRKSLTGLAAFVVRQRHSAALEKALQRDADTVAQALATSEKLLAEEMRWIALREDAERRNRYLNGVRKPFLAGAELGADWKKAWAEQVRPAPVSDLLSEARKASVDIQKSWLEILRGEPPGAAIFVSLRKLKAGIDAMPTRRAAN